MSDAERALRLLEELERQPAEPGAEPTDAAESAIAASAILKALLKNDFDLGAAIVDVADGA